MGAWEELDIFVGATTDVSELDNLIEECNSDSDFADIFEGAIQEAEALKTAIEEGTEQGLDITASKIISIEQTEILDTGKHPYSQGILGSSIYKEEEGEGWLIGTRINHIYPMSVEYGADIFPVTAKMLKFQLITGEIIFAPYVHQEPKPFVEPAYERIVGLIESEGFGVFRSVCEKIDNLS